MPLLRWLGMFLCDLDGHDGNAIYIGALLGNLYSWSYYLAKPCGIRSAVRSLSLGFAFDSNTLSGYGSEEYTFWNSMTFAGVKRTERNEFLCQVKHFIPHNGRRRTHFYSYHCIVSLWREMLTCIVLFTVINATICCYNVSSFKPQKAASELSIFRCHLRELHLSISPTHLPGCNESSPAPSVSLEDMGVVYAMDG